MIVIPMAGNSSRFFKAGFDRPKHQLTLHGRYVFDLAVASFANYFANEPFLFIVRDTYHTLDFVEQRVQALGIQQYKIKVLAEDTKGQAHTVYLGIEDPTIADDEPIWIFNIDTFHHNFTKPDFIDQVDGYLEVFKGEGDHWSFVASDANDRVIQTAEKQRISEYCSNGLYYFKSKALFMQMFEDALKQALRVKGEYYIAPLYNILLDQGCIIRQKLVDIEDMSFCGTPDEYHQLRSAD